jgi:MFS family permease
MKYRHRVLALLLMLSVITYLDRVCIAVAAPAMMSDLGISPDRWGWVVGIFAIAYGAFEIPTGAMGDRIGPRKVLTRIVIWWSAFTSLTGVVSNYFLLLATRFLFGAGEAGAYPNSSAAVSRWFPTTERARAHGLIWMASRLGGAISPILVIPIQQAYGWRASFWVFGIAGVVWAIVWYAWFRDNPWQKPGVTREEMLEIGVTEHRHEHHALPWAHVLRSGNLWAIMVMYHTYCWGAFFFLSWMPVFLANGRGFDNADLRRLAWIPYCFGACANLLGGIVGDRLVKKLGLRWGRRTVALIGLGCSTLAIVGTIFTDDKVLSVILLGLAYGGSDFMLPVAWALCLDIGRRYAGAVTGAMNTAGQIGSFFTSVAFGYVVRLTGSYNAPLIPMAVMTAIATVLWLKIDPTEQLVKEPAEATAGTQHV